MSRIEIDQERCKGCLLCTTVCPEDLLEQGLMINALGYKTVQVKAGKEKACKGCTFCAQICPDCVITVYRSKSKKKGE